MQGQRAGIARTQTGYASLSASPRSGKDLSDWASDKREVPVQEIVVLCLSWDAGVQEMVLGGATFHTTIPACTRLYLRRTSRK
ncbi:hypothetical protein TGRH88_028950 [Toxoplasma gondii]|uniref:Uncharacterized protein n=1 Tax=Toxoplasma gondii TaxID=5811 RepID=A0A7J6K7Z1_TOXGO|nr:hypothetical protein TGRH88_028950 [Toxoplasma gondii]